MVNNINETKAKYIKMGFGGNQSIKSHNPYIKFFQLCHIANYANRGSDHELKCRAGKNECSYVTACKQPGNDWKIVQ